MEPSRPHAPQPQGAGAAPTPRAGPLRGTSTSTGQPAGPLRSVSWRLQKFNFPSRVACPQSPGPPRAPNLCPPAGPQARHPLCRAVGGEGPTPTPALSLQPPQRALQAPLQQSHFPVREAPRVRLRFPLTFISRYCPEPHPLRQKQLPLPLTCAHFPQAGLCPPPAPPPTARLLLVLHRVRHPDGDWPVRSSLPNTPSAPEPPERATGRQQPRKGVPGPWLAAACPWNPRSPLRGTRPRAGAPG